MSNIKLLSETGLMCLWDKITNLFAKKTDLNNYTKTTDIEKNYLKINGTAASANKLANPVNINGIPFDGSSNISVSDSTKLPLSGGTITGPISYKTATGTFTPLSIHDGTASGAGIVVGAGGRTIIGAGEAPQNLRTALGADDTVEHMYMASDNCIYLVTNCNTIANRVTVTIDNNGSITTPGSLIVNQNFIPAGAHGTQLPATGTPGQVFFLHN